MSKACIEYRSNQNNSNPSNNSNISNLKCCNSNMANIVRNTMYFYILQEFLRSRNKFKSFQKQRVLKSNIKRTVISNLREVEVTVLFIGCGQEGG